MNTDKNNIPTNSGFKTPNNYFDNLTGNLLLRLDLESQLSNTEDQGFIVPPSYFISNKKNMTESILLLDNKEKPTTVKTVPRFIYTALAVAAALLLLIVLKPFAQAQDDLTNIDAIAVQTYLEYNSLENIEYDAEWLLASEETDLLLDGVSTSKENILNYLQDETDLIDLTID